MIHHETREELALKELYRQRAQKPVMRRQSDIVRDNRTLIVGLIRDQGASKKEVAAVLKGIGEPVREKGFYAELLKILGKIKQIRAPIANPAPGPVQSAPSPTATSSASPMTSNDFDDDDDAFVARRPRTLL